MTAGGATAASMARRPAVSPRERTTKPDSSITVGQGDSGGPVLSPIPGGGLNATARGLISLIMCDVLTCAEGDDCSGLTMSGRFCFDEAFHINIDAIQDGLLVDVKVTP